MLGPLEQEIVAVLKELQEGNTRAVLEGLRRRNTTVAYTTVSTILTRLLAKGVIGRRSEAFKGGERHIYMYRDIEEAYIDDLLGGLISTFGQPGVVHLTQRLGSLGEDDYQRLRHRMRS